MRNLLQGSSRLRRLVALVFAGLGMAVWVHLAEAQLSVVPSLSVTERYEDNIFLTETNRQEAFITVLTPALALSYRHPNWNFMAAYALGGEIYARHGELNTITHALRGNLTGALGSRTSLSLTGGYMQAPTSLAALPEGEAAGITVERTTTRRMMLDTALRHEYGERWRFDVGYRFEILQFDNPVLEDSKTHRVPVTIRYRLTPRDLVTLGYEYQALSFTTVESANVHTVRAGYVRNIRPTLTLELGAGVLIVEAIGQEEGDSVPFFLVALDRRTPRGAFRLSLAQTAGTSGGLGGITRTQAVALSYTNAFTAQLSGRASANVSKATSLREEGVDIRTYGFGAELTYAFRPWLSGSLAYDHLTQDAREGVGLDIRSNRIMVRLTATWPGMRPSVQPTPTF